MVGYSARCLNVTVSVSTTKLNLRVIVFVISWTRFSGFSDPKMGPFSGPKKRGCWQAMPLAVAPAIVLDGGDGEDPEGDNDVDTAESEEEGGRDGDFVV